MLQKKIRLNSGPELWLDIVLSNTDAYYLNIQKIIIPGKFNFIFYRISISNLVLSKS